MYYQLRLTFSTILKIEDDCLGDADIDSIYAMIRHMLDVVDDDTEYSCADEVLNKYGEKTHRHLHFNFESDTKKPALRARLLRYANIRNLVIKGNTMYSLSCVAEPKDHSRWLRYCMKENCRKKYTKCDNIKELTLLARDERKRSVEANIIAREKMLIKATLYDRLVIHLDKLNVQQEKSIFIAITKFYVKEKKPVQAVTIKGYTLTYMLFKKYISFDFFYDRSK